MRLEDKIKDRKVINEILENPILSQDLLLMICGELLGEGSSRKVFEYNLDNDYVVKFEMQNEGHNQNEFLIWEEVQGLKGELAWVKKWFAPICYISPCSRILIMERTMPKEGKKRPDKVPAFLDDTHGNNFGWIGNKFVCHDYGFIHGFIKYGKKMVKPVYLF